MLKSFFPENSKRRELVKSILRLFGWRAAEPYDRWRQDQSDKVILHKSYSHKVSPLVSIVVPAFNTPDKYLEPLVRSVAAQTYPNWELVLVDASTNGEASLRIDRCKEIDSRIVVTKVANGGISKNTNFGINKAKGDYVAVMDHDDTIEHNALDEFVHVINADSNADLMYSDEDKLSEDGRRYENPHFKPGWSPHLLTHVNYITHMVVVKKSIAEKVGLLDPSNVGAQDFDFVMKVADTGANIVHIPKVLYHWRVADNSTAADISNKTYVLGAGEEALKEHFKRKKLSVSVKARKNMPGFYSVKYENTKQPRIVIMPFASRTLIVKYVELLSSLGHLDNIDVVLPFEVNKFKYLKVAKSGNYVEFLEEALSGYEGEVIAIGDFVVPETKGWPESLSGLLNDNSVHAVSPAILSHDGVILDMGLLRSGGATDSLFAGLKHGVSTPFGDTSWPRDVDSLTGSLMAFRSNDMKLFIRNNSQCNYSNKLLLNRYSKANNLKYNVLWADTVMRHVKVPVVSAESGESSYFSPNIYTNLDGLHLYADNQQILDAIIAQEQDSE